MPVVCPNDNLYGTCTDSSYWDPDSTSVMAISELSSSIHSESSQCYIMGAIPISLDVMLVMVLVYVDVSTRV